MSLVKIDVEYYSKKEEDLLKTNYPEEYETLNKSIKKGVTVPFEDFKIYSQFHHQNSEISEFRDFGNIRNQLPDLWGSLNAYTKYSENDEKFTSKYSHNNEQTGISESIGCAGSLSFLSFAYGLTDADWARINIQGHRDFDFNSAVIEGFTKLIVVETKGSIVADTSGSKDSKITSHKSKIKEKKKDEGFKKKYSNGADLFIAGITAIDPNNHVKLFLVDPPTESSLTNDQRKRIKLLKRLNYYNSIFKFISKRSYFSLMLTNRINTLNVLENVDLLNNIFLSNSQGEPISLNESTIRNYSHIDFSVIGRFFPVSNELAVFIGLPLELFELIASQNYEEILKYKTESKTKTKSLDCRISLSSKANKVFLNKTLNNAYSNENGYARFETKPVEVFQSSSGLNFAVIYSYQIL